MKKNNLKKILNVIAMNQTNDGFSNRHVLLDGEMDKDLIRTIKDLDIPTFTCSASTIAMEGYFGFHLSDILRYLVESTNGDLQKAQRAVVVIDDFEQMSMDERFISPLVEDGTEDEIKKHVHKEMISRSLNQLSLTSYLRGITIPFTAFGEDGLFDTSKLSFILVGDYKDMGDFDIYSGYHSAFTNTLMPVISREKDKPSKETSKKNRK